MPVAALLPLALGACALPVGVQVASLVVDGVSFIATDKSLSDHGLSYVAGRDCAMWRVVKGEEICRDIAPDPIMVVEADTTPEVPTPQSASSEPAVDDNETLSVERLAAFDLAAGGNDASSLISAFSTALVPTPTQPTAAQIIKQTPSSPGLQLAAVTDRQQSSPQRVQKVAAPVAVKSFGTPPEPPHAARQSGTFYVIASFRNAANAERFAATKRELKPAILPGTAHGKRAYRVAIGPVIKTKRVATRRNLTKAGFKDAWALSFSNPRLIMELAALE